MPKSSYTFEVGDSFTLRNQFGIHLHFVVAETSPTDPRSIMIVYITSTMGPQIDKTTILQPGDHQFVVKQSWVKYQNIMIAKKEEIEALIETHYGQIEAALLERIQNGILKSEHSGKYKQIYEEWHQDKLFREI